MILKKVASWMSIKEYDVRNGKVNPFDRKSCTVSRWVRGGRGERKTETKRGQLWEGSG